jgi:hypothetical protein
LHYHIAGGATVFTAQFAAYATLLRPIGVVCFAPILLGG